MTNDEPFTIGVEEEYQIVHPATRELRSRAHLILPEAQAALGNLVTPELYQSQIEIATSICNTVAEVRAKIVRLRGEVIAAAEKYGNRIVAAGTHPFSHWEDQQLTPKARYRGIAAEFQQLASEQLIFGCHVHIGISDREAAIQVMNRARPWLAPL
jgi:carboxylate-amine ligase